MIEQNLPERTQSVRGIMKDSGLLKELLISYNRGDPVLGRERNYYAHVLWCVEWLDTIDNTTNSLVHKIARDEVLEYVAAMDLGKIDLRADTRMKEEQKRVLQGIDQEGAYRNLVNLFKAQAKIK